MDIYREINNNNLYNNNLYNKSTSDIIWKHIYSTYNLSIDDLGLEDDIMYDEEREEYYPMTAITLRTLGYALDRIKSSMQYYSQNPTSFRNSDWMDRMTKARNAFQKEIDEQDENTYYLLVY